MGLKSAPETSLSKVISCIISNENHTANDAVICYSTIEKLDPDLDPKSGSQAGSGSGIRIQKKPNL